MEAPSPLSQADIEHQLNRILAFSTFSNSNILSGFLKFIVMETLEGRSHLLKEYTIGMHVLAKRNHYETQSDASVRIHAGRLRRALYEYYSNGGKNDTILISVPKGAYVPKFESITPAELLVIKENENVFNKPTIAVLPFQLHKEGQYHALADGLCDQLCTELTNFSELSVVSYYSSKLIANKVEDIREIGNLLDARYLLTGTIQSYGTTVRIRVQLVQTSTLHQIWACVYDRDNASIDTFSIQDDIVRHVVNQIGGSHGIIFREAARVNPGKRILDIKVYDAIFWYYYLNNESTEEVYQKALASMKEAIRLDPQYALGWSVLSETYVAGFFNGYNCHTADPLEEAVKCGKTALRLDIRAQHAYQALALAYLFQHKPKECVQIADQWLKLKSNVASIAGGIGFCLICAGDYERGHNMLSDSVHLNPYYQWWFNAGLAFYHFNKNEFEDAIYWANKMHPHNDLWESLIKSASYSAMGRLAEGKSQLATVRDMTPGFDETLPLHLHAFLQSEELIAKLQAALTKLLV